MPVENDDFWNKSTFNKTVLTNLWFFQLKTQSPSVTVSSCRWMHTHFSEWRGSKIHDHALKYQITKRPKILTLWPISCDSSGMKNWKIASHSSSFKKSSFLNLGSKVEALCKIHIPLFKHPWDSLCHFCDPSVINTSKMIQQFSLKWCNGRESRLFLLAHGCGGGFHWSE